MFPVRRERSGRCMRNGLEAFPKPFPQVSLIYVLEESIPQATDDFDQVIVELRVFF